MMKTLSTFTAVAALIAGMSFASAQAPATSSKPAIKGSAAFCFEGTSGKLNCTYASLEACQKNPKLKGRKCVANPGTTGAK